MPFSIDTRSQPGVLVVTLSGLIRVEEMQAFVVANNAAVASFGVADYRVFCDSRHLVALSPEAAALLEQAKAFSSGRANFQGSAVLVASSVVAMQHERTSTAGLVISSELITDDEAVAWAHLASVQRTVKPTEDRAQVAPGGRR